MRLRAKSFCLLLERDRHAVVDVDVGIVHRFEPGWTGTSDGSEVRLPTASALAGTHPLSLQPVSLGHDCTVPVGTALSGRPPDRARRADFPHRAPTLGQRAAKRSSGHG